jgi:hypothetical protein
MVLESDHLPHGFWQDSNQNLQVMNLSTALTISPAGVDPGGHMRHAPLISKGLKKLTINFNVKCLVHTPFPQTNPLKLQ